MFWASMGLCCVLASTTTIFVCVLSSVILLLRSCLYILHNRGKFSLKDTTSEYVLESLLLPYLACILLVMLTHVCRRRLTHWMLPYVFTKAASGAFSRSLTSDHGLAKVVQDVDVPSTSLMATVRAPAFGMEVAQNETRNPPADTTRTAVAHLNRLLPGESQASKESFMVSGAEKLAGHGNKCSSAVVEGAVAIDVRVENSMATVPEDFEDPYWTKISRWKDVTKEQFLSYAWQTRNSPQTEKQLAEFLTDVLPASIPAADCKRQGRFITAADFIQDVRDGMKSAPMSIRITPHTLARINWQQPLHDPIRRQFIPLRSTMLEDHPKLTLDSLHEEEDSISEGLVHRYPDKALFLTTSACPVYCRFCTRSYAVGGNTEMVQKKSQKPSRRRWDAAIEKIAETPALNDIVVSGGDSFYLQPEHLLNLGRRILAIPHIRRIRFASKGLAVCPSRFLDKSDNWTTALEMLSGEGRDMGKSVALHTHFNHPEEISWVTRQASQRLFAAAITVRNQSVLLKGVNDDVATMKTLIRSLADINVIPYYVYQGDMVRSVEELRTPLQTILDLEAHIRGSIAGFMVPSFVVDLPGGGGKRLAASFLSYDRRTGISRFRAPAVKGGEEVFEYCDPVWAVDQFNANGGI